jgi:hypothetical protein
MALEYITTRDIVNKAGEEKGKVRIMKSKEDSQAVVELTCPECGFLEKRKEDWKEPFVTGEKSKQTFLVKCRKCPFSMKMLKLKKEAAKKK